MATLPMKYIRLPFLFVLVFSYYAFSQAGLLFYAGNGIASEISKSKKSKLVERYSRNVFIESDSVTILRVPEEKIRSQAKENILSVQRLLDKAYGHYLANKYVEIDIILSNIYVITPNDQNWNIELYKNEAQAYRNYDMARRERERKEEHEKHQRETKRRDSLRVVREKRHAFVYDSLNIVRKTERQREDSLMIEHRCKGYYFVNVDESDLKEKPLDKSRTIASVGGTSYVKILSKPVNGYVQIEISDLTGYIKESVLVGSIYNINYQNADVQYAKRNYTTSITETAEQTRYNDKIYRKSVPQYDTGKQYYRGPRGGCYYYSSSGKKVYVDHSYCN